MWEYTMLSRVPSGFFTSGKFKMKIKPQKLALAFASAAMMTLAGCGGGSDSPLATSGVTPLPIVPGQQVTTLTSVPVTVIDGAIQNATVCLDKNLNGVCDAGEPSGKTDASGKVNLQVAAEDVGKYPVLAVVGKDAVDADHGPVTTAFTMQAPADQSTVVSPLTTLVQSVIASTGSTSAQAEASVKEQTGLSASLFEDFTKGTSADSLIAGTLARMVVVTTQQQSTALTGALGTSALDGAPITQANLDKLIQNKLLEILPALLTALADPTVQAATTPEAKAAALLAQANTLVASAENGLTSSSVATLVAVNNQIASATTVVAEAPSAGGTLNNLVFKTAGNWFSRMFTSSVAQNTPDAAGMTKYVERRRNSDSGAVAVWGAGSSANRQSDLHFNGSAWVSCALNYENTSSVRDAKGNSTYNYCDNAETGKSNRATFDIGDKTMASVITDVRAAGYTNLSIGDNSVSALTTALGATTFPTGSKLFYQTSTPLTAAISYYPGTGNIATQYSATVSAGGTANAQNPGEKCNSAEFKGNGSNSTSLENLISANTGTPCVFAQGSFTYNTAKYTSPDASDEAWGNSTMGIGTLGTAPVGTGATAPGFYSGNTKLRIAFKGTGTNPVTYYACKERFNNGSTRNCSAIGTGSYSIASLGDARVMTLSGLPAQAAALTFTRVLVERGGKIFYGYQNKLNVSNSARLNLKAANALFTQLSLPLVNPETPLALTKTSYAGDWNVTPASDANSSTLIQIFPNGSSTCVDTVSGVTGKSFNCSINFADPANGNFTGSTVDGTWTGNANFLTGVITGSWVNSTNSSDTDTFTGARR